MAQHSARGSRQKDAADLATLTGALFARYSARTVFLECAVLEEESAAFLESLSSKSAATAG
jgi:hypothetical protein